MEKRDFRPHNVSRSSCGVSGSTTQLRSSTNPPQPANPYQATNGSNNSKSNNNVVTITRCSTNNSTSSHAQNSSSYLNRIPASTTITPTQYYNSKDSSLPSSLSIYPKNSKMGNARSIVHSSVSPVIASPTRASPQAGYAKQPSISPAAPLHIPALVQQQLDDLLLKQSFNGIPNQELLKETLLTYNSMYAKAQQNNAAASMSGNQSSSTSNNPSYPIRNKSVITTTRTSAMDVIDLSASNSPTPRSMSGVTALQLQQAQVAASAANKRAHSGQYLNGNQQSRSLQSSSSASSRLQQQMQIHNSLAGMNGYGSSAYKIEKSYIENQMVHCINMIPYSPNSDMIIPLSEMRDQFYPNAGLDICKRVMQALDINLYSGTK